MIAPGSTGAARGLRALYPRWWLILAVWTAWGLLLSAQVAVYVRLGGQAMPFLMAARLNMPGALIWALFTPGVIWLGRTVPPFEGPRWARGLALHLAVCAVLVFLEVLVVIVNQRWLREYAVAKEPLLLAAVRSFVWWFPSDGLLYWAVLAIDYGVGHYRRLRERELRASQLEAQLSEARLEALKMQLQPHFLFNALHTIGQLIRTHRDVAAVQMVARLGDLLRRVLAAATTQEVPLKQELEFVRSYLEIERVRFRDRLAAVVEVSPETEEACVPHLILQPLVENAIRHGIAARGAGGRLHISARRVGSELHLTVVDDGAGLAGGPADGAEHQGVGLKNTSARLHQLYGDAASFALTNGENGGVEARVVLPFHLAPAEWQGAKEG